MHARHERLWPATLALAGLLALAGCRSITDWLRGTPESIRQYDGAKALFEKERYAEAAVAFHAWLADYRDKSDLLRPHVLFKLGECYRVLRDYERAATAYTSLIELYGAFVNPNPESQKTVQDLVMLARLRLDDIGPVAKPEPAPKPAPPTTSPSANPSGAGTKP